MTDDRDWSWLTRTPTAVPDAIEEHPLWALVKRDHRVECRVRATPAGPELRIMLDGELWWSQVVRPATPEAMAAASDIKREDFVTKGWQDAGPHSARRVGETHGMKHWSHDYQNGSQGLVNQTTSDGEFIPSYTGPRTNASGMATVLRPPSTTFEDAIRRIDEAVGEESDPAGWKPSSGSK